MSRGDPTLFPAPSLRLEADRARISVKAEAQMQHVLSELGTSNARGQQEGTVLGWQQLQLP